MKPRPYWPRTMCFGPGVWSARSTFTFSLRTDSASKAAGGSIAMIARSWSRWFWTMSRIAPASS